MSDELDLVVDRSWEIYYHYKGLFCWGRTQWRAVRRVAEYAFHEGRAFERDQVKANTETPPEKGKLRVVVEQHRSLLSVLVAIATTATASVGATTLTSGWTVTAASWVVSLLGALMIGARAWLTR